MPPFKLRKAPKRELYWVVDEKGKHFSKEPLPKERATAQLRALYASDLGDKKVVKRKKGGMRAIRTIKASSATPTAQPPTGRTSALRQQRLQMIEKANAYAAEKERKRLAKEVADAVAKEVSRREKSAREKPLRLSKEAKAFREREEMLRDIYEEPETMTQKFGEVEGYDDEEVPEYEPFELVDKGAYKPNVVFERNVKRVKKPRALPRAEGLMPLKSAPPYKDSEEGLVESAYIQVKALQQNLKDIDKGLISAPGLSKADLGRLVYKRFIDGYTGIIPFVTDGQEIVENPEFNRLVYAVPEMVNLDRQHAAGMVLSYPYATWEEMQELPMMELDEVIGALEGYLGEQSYLKSLERGERGYGMRGGVATHKEKVLERYNLSKKGHSLRTLSKVSGVPLRILQEVYNRGVGAYKTNPRSVRLQGSYVKNVDAPMRLKLSKEQWGMARVYSFLDGNPKHDNDLRRNA
jgi:hypothetical protein